MYRKAEKVTNFGLMRRRAPRAALAPPVVGEAAQPGGTGDNGTVAAGASGTEWDSTPGLGGGGTGGKAAAGSNSGCYGAGGGGYSKAVNLTLSGSVDYSVGGHGAPTDATMFRKDTSSTNRGPTLGGACVAL